jgi:hypothetical protein
MLPDIVPPAKGKSRLAPPVKEPMKVVAVIVPAVKLPEPSLITIVLGVFDAVAALAALAPKATLAAETPPTL